jgi:ferrochelatase
MSHGVLLINFGEPDEPTLEKVSAFLERIFLQNASLEGHVSDAAIERTRQLAQRRAPGLLEEYRTIGGSPLNAQADAQAASLRDELARRGIDAIVYSAFQFTEPSVAAVVAKAMADGVDSLVAMPGYPLCGQSRRSPRSMMCGPRCARSTGARVSRGSPAGTPTRTTSGREAITSHHSCPRTGST